MNEKISRIKNIIKNPKIIIILGIVGIVLIFISSLTGKSGNEKGVETKKKTDTETYKAEITENVKNIVKSITGDSSPTVVVTLESGVKYVYADAGEFDTVSTSGTGTNQESESSKRSYVTVKDSEGGENALVVTENMPEIRGVAVICKGGENEETAQIIKNAVTAALNITSKRVYISGGNGNEEN